MSEEQKALPGPSGEHPHKREIRTGIHRHLIVGIGAAIFLVFGLGGMAATIDFASAVVTSGRVIVRSNVKKVQHQQGGIVAEIDVKDGDHVKAGDVLIKLDPTMAAANLGIVTKGLDEALAHKARLEAESSGQTTLQFPASLTTHATDPGVAEIMSIEKNAFELRLAAREGQKDQLRKKITQLQEQLDGIKAQEDATRRQLNLTDDEVAGLRKLKDQDLVGTQRMNDAERQAAQLQGQLGQIISAAGQTGAEIAQAQLQILQVDSDARSQVSRELADVGASINELAEKKIAAEDQLRRLEIRAPISGTVYQLAVHTVGGVVGPGEDIMMIVPQHDLLLVEAQVTPNEVDRVHPDQEAILRFTSFGNRTTPQFHGSVETVSPDIVVDQRTGHGYYIARIGIPKEAFDRYGSRIVPGMPVEVLIATGSRTVLSFLTKPLVDQIMHTFRER